jgi:hypothetical protein
MAIQSMTALASITLQQATASISFSTIPQNYRDLILVVNGKIVSGADAFTLQFNGDTGNNYNYVQFTGGGSSASTFAVLSTPFARLGSIFTGDGSFYGQIFDYSATDKHKTILGRGSTASSGVHMTASRWANTNAINSIRVFPNGETFAAGSTFNLYGRIA